MPDKRESGEVADRICFDGEVFFVTCTECGHEKGDIDHHVKSEECGAGPMPTVEDLA